MRRGLLQSGLGRFGLVNMKQPQPGDYATVLVFVVGGVSLADLREARQTIDDTNGGEGGRSTRILVGGTTLLAPADFVNILFPQ
jgi:hypothetical protein